MKLSDKTKKQKQGVADIVKDMEWEEVIEAFNEFEDINCDVIEQIIIIGKYGSIRRLIIKKKEDETFTFRYIG